MLDKCLSTRELGERLNVCRNTVLTMLQRGAFEHAFKTPGGQWRVPAKDVEAFLARQRTALRENGR